MAIIEMKGIRRHYQVGEVVVKAIRGLDLAVDQGEFVSIMGPSGSGKSTLMNILGCLDKPTEGSYFLDGTETSKASGDEFARIRNEKIGFVFQGFNLLSKTTPWRTWSFRSSILVPGSTTCPSAPSGL